MTPIDLQKRLALKLKLNKIDNCGIAASILLNEILAKNGYQTKLVQGYSSLNEDTCWHVWVEITDKSVTVKLDIGKTIASLSDKEFEKCNMILHTNLAPGARKPSSDQETLDNWELYQSDHQAFWKKQSMKLQNFRAKSMNEKW